MTVETTEVTGQSEQPSMQEQAAKFAAENPEVARQVGLETKEPSSEPAAPSDDRPDFLLDKFKSIEDQARAFVELERKLGERSSESEPEVPASGEAAAETGDGGDSAAEEAAEAAGLDLSALSDKWQENGTLDAEDYAALKRVGISESDVEFYVKGREAAAQAFTSSVYEAAGGEDAYAAATAWAAENYDDTKIDAFNADIASNNPQVARLAVRELLAAYQEAEGSAPARQVTGDTGGGATVGYSSQADWMADMQKPEYQTDAAFRERVQKRAQATKPGIL